MKVENLRNKTEKRQKKMDCFSSDDDSVLSFDDVSANDVEDNPWNVTNLNEFCFFLCPEFQRKEPNSFPKSCH